MFQSPLSYAMLSDPGRVRQRNEDACAADPEHGAFVVCDGVGGAAGGEVASQLAASTFLARLKAASRAGADAGLEIEDKVRTGIEAANHAVHSQAQERAELSGMATTLVAMVFVAEEHPDGAATQAGTVWLANVGDSRCYRLRDEAFEQVTEDHSLVGEQVRNGLMTREEAEVSPIRNVITRAIGSESAVEADVQCLAASHGDLFLLSSDGLTRELSDGEVAQVLKAVAAVPNGAEEGDLAAGCAELVHRANMKGGGDNITCLLVKIR